jgi:phosphopantothenoylcysteine synthetase/decarboxylase
MNIFVTAGNTQTPVDRVRCITNIFSGKTGARIAIEAFGRGHTVTLATSHPEVVDRTTKGNPQFRVVPYRTFDELEAIMAREIGSARYDAVIHAAAVNDYHVAGVYGLSPGTAFDTDRKQWSGAGQMVPTTGGKIKGNHSELWIRMTPAPKLVDKIRKPWGFTGTLVKFKLGVGLSEPELIAVGERARIHSHANLLVANTLEEMNEWAYLLGEKSKPRKLNRSDLAKSLIDVIELKTCGGV